MSLYGLLIGIGFALAAHYFTLHNHSISDSHKPAFILLVFLFSFIGARLYHVFDYWAYYSQYPLQVLNTPAGGLGIYGGIIGALIFIFGYTGKTRIPLLSITDTIAPVLPLAQSLGRFGNFINHEGFGPPTSLPWGQFISPQHRPPQFASYSTFHPTWLYESILDLILFLFISRLKYRFSPTALYLLGYGLIRFFLEFLRFDTWTFSGLKIAQIISLISIFISTILLRK